MLVNLARAPGELKRTLAPHPGRLLRQAAASGARLAAYSHQRDQRETRRMRNLILALATLAGVLMVAVSATHTF